ncbi:MAG: ABC transporter ATP-binding protein/permease [Planctomycetes bacterium]|nr:ABC transporter ATP-binding protein/permease [Planctomycetota bacterium]
MADSSAEHNSPAAHDVGHGHSLPRPFARLKQLLLPERRDIVAVIVFAVAVALLSLATPIAVESLVNTVAFGVLMWPVVVIAGILMTCLGLAAAIRAMQVYVVECIQRRLFVRVVADYAHRLPRLRLDAFDHRYGPELANRFFDVLTFQKSLAFVLLDGVALFVTALVGMVVLAFYHPFLLGFDILLLLMIAFVLFVLGWGGVRTCLHESHAKYDVAAWLEELLRCLRAFKFAGGRQMALERADQLASEYVAARRDHFRVVWRQTVFAFGLQVVASTALLGLGGYLVINRQLSLGQLVASELIVTLVVASVAKLGKYAETYYDLMSSAEKLGLITDLPLEREGGEVLAASESGLALRVHGVDRVSHCVLPTSTDWRVAPNERVAVVGPPGSGKTTLFEVLCGLRAPSQGVVEMDGIDMRGLSLEQLRKQVVLIEGADIFNGTVMENVRVGRPELLLGDVREALRVVGLIGAVHDLSHGLDTPLTPSGRPLSASQGLRLTIARALVGRPRLLILDGVLDALDPRDCPDLLPYLFDRAAPWTLLVASISPIVVGMCDRIISMSGGELPAHTPPS